MKSEEGYTLVESLIALSLLMAVIVPSAMFLIFVGNNTFAKEKTEAFNMARNRIELSLATRNDSTIIKQIDSKWWVKQKVDKDGDLRTIKVEIFKTDTLDSPLITLQTARLWYD